MYDPQIEETSAYGSIRGNAPTICCYAFSGLAALSTAASPIPVCVNDWGTSSNLPAMQSSTEKQDAVYSETTRAAISELRLISGFTWDHIANIFNVSRRSVHNWANGKPMNQGHEDKLFSVLNVVRRVDAGSATQNRSAFLQKSESGESPLEMLADSKFEEAIRTIGVSPTPRSVSKPISKVAWEDRIQNLQPPLGALHGGVHNSSGETKRVDRNKFRNKRS